MPKEERKEAILGFLEGMNGIPSFIIRSILDRGDMTFTEAVAYIKTHLLFTACYIIMGGVKSGEGVVITRSIMASLDEWTVNASNGTWYILETNYDHWTSHQHTIGAEKQ